MKKRLAWRGPAVVAAMALGLLVGAMPGTAVAQPPPVSVAGSVTYAADNHNDGGCFHATSTSTVDARLRVFNVPLPLKGTLTIDRYDNGYSLCGPPSSFQFKSFFGGLTGPVSTDTVDCHGSDPNPNTTCTLSLGLTATDGTGLFKLFHLFNGQLQVQVEFKLISGQFPGAFGTAGTGTIGGTLNW